MRLKRLQLHGFKSFADRTEIQIHDGITAIVGPNGCGKSNISDAIRWVLGEQRASAIRGSKMEEAIFQGTMERRAVNRAEAALVFSNDDGRLALPQKEVEVRRTVFREGGSDYALNRSICRLRDILDLFRDTGLGSNAYAVIEQGMVDAILSERADERRQMFEEAAGIGRYKDRRKGAQRRLEGAQQDLARLEDVISEVDAKVRSLGRQRKRALRYQDLRSRRLALELAVAQQDLAELTARLRELGTQLERLGQEEPSARGALSTAETELERCRLESGELARERGLVAMNLEDTSRRIAERERELAVAEERRGQAQRRLEQIARERTELVERSAELEREVVTEEAARVEQQQVVAELDERVRKALARQQVLREELSAARRSEEQGRAREKELGRRIGALEGDAAAADARVSEATDRLGRLAQEQEELLAELSQLEQQGDLFSVRARELAEQRTTLSARREQTADRLDALRTYEHEVRRELAQAEDSANVLSARVAALESLEREFHGFAPPVAAALGARERIEGLLGPVAEFLDLDPERSAAVEATVGPLLQALVTRDRDASAGLREWLVRRLAQDTGEAPESGTVAMLPRSALTHLEALVDALEFAGEAPSEPVILGRRERLARLRTEAAQAAEERAAKSEARSDVLERIAELEAELRDDDARLEALDLELRRAESDQAVRTARRARAERSLDELEQRRAGLRLACEEAKGQGAAAREEHARLESELAEHRRAWQHAAETLSERESTWESVHEADAELRVAHARAEGALGALERRLASAREALTHARTRLEALDREEDEHRRTLELVAGVDAEAGADLEDLFAQRDERNRELRGYDERLSLLNEQAEALEAEARTLRRGAEERSETRHRLELERAEGEARQRSIHERLELEWHAPLAQLLETATPAEGERETLRAELQSVQADIDRLGPINMLAIEEFDEESKRLEFLTAQRDDLVRARDDLQTAIREINKTARQLFATTFEAIRANFKRTFQTLFEGGECDIQLADSEDPLEATIDISASPRGKRTQRIHLLSGGERALTALALLFAIYLVKPSPFCVLDEVDAPLDEANIARFLDMLKEFKGETQFIIITHNPRTMEAADWIYGVTMEEPGVSTVVGVKLDDVVAAREATAAV
jgi:chromosome segregation protein